ncbi:MAG: hypothetical protein U0002_10740 [Thermoanaerobaculia bacterium]
MPTFTDQELLAAQTGNLSTERAAELERTLASDPELRRRHERWQRAWHGIGLGPSRPVPPSFRARVVARAFREAGGGLAAPPGWLRWAAAAALAGGVALGFGLGWSGPSPAKPEQEIAAFSPSWAETYLDDLAGDGSDFEATP